MTVKWQSHAYMHLRDSVYPQWIPSELTAIYFPFPVTVNWVDLNRGQRAFILTRTSDGTTRCVYAAELQAAFPDLTVYGAAYDTGQGFSLLAFAGNNPLLRC